MFRNSNSNGFNSSATPDSRMSSSSNSYPNNRPNTNVKRSTTLRGSLINGVWHCDCDPPSPAAFFETRNGGRHHGRWFHTCSKSKRQGCDFFLWDDEARVRAGAMTSGNGNTNGNGTMSGDVNAKADYAAPKTPSTRRTIDFSQSETGLLTPDTGKKRQRDVVRGENGSGFESPSKNRRIQKGGQGGQDSFGWNESFDGALVDRSLNQDGGLKQEPEDDRGAAGSTHRLPASQGHGASFQTPLPSSSSTLEHSSCPPLQREIYPSTPTNATRFNSAPLSLPKTPQLDPQSSPSASHPHCPLISQTLTLLDSHGVTLPSNTKDDLINLLNTHNLRTKGIVRGRDISRLAIKKKDEQIQELAGRIEVLEAEREAWRAARMKEGQVKQEREAD